MAVPRLLRSVPRPRVTEGWVLFATAFAAYLALGLVLVLHFHAVVGDALARVGNASYVVAGRDPHLAALGFVWNPLPSLAEIPLVALRGLWRPIVSEGVAGTVMSAAFMAGSVAVVSGILRDHGLGRGGRCAGAAAFAVQPMIVLYGANGMSEAPMVFFLLLATRSLARWLDEPAEGDLVRAGFALGLAYLTRYEAVAAGAAAVAVVAGVTACRTHDGWRRRLQYAMADAIIVAFPLAVAVAGFAAVSWVIVGHPFETFSSAYGNSSQVAGAADSIRALAATPGAALHYALSQLLGLQPLLPVAAIVAAVWSAARRDLRVLAGVAVLGAPLAFQVSAFVGGSTFGWLRFSILGVPLAVVLLAAIAPRPATARWRIVRPVALVGLSASLAASGVVGSVRTLLDPVRNREDVAVARALTGHPVAAAALDQSLTDREVARWLDDQHLGRGAVLVDVAVGFRIVLRSHHPAQWVITPDRDFEQILADPAQYDVRYLLVANPANGGGRMDAVTRTYPNAYRGGAGFGPPVKEWDNRWRLYRVDPVAR